MNCRKCGRALKNPKYIQIGIGPVCLKKQNAEKAKSDKMDPGTTYLPYNDGDDIVLKREGMFGENKIMNVRRTIVKHSPDGFEWGYGGSGPADLALNILAMFVPENRAQEIYQDFKFEFVAAIPKEGGIIKFAEIQKFIERKNCE
jgi:hypothetical protein